MDVLRATIQRNVDNVRRRIEAAAKRVGRAPGDVTLIPITKTVGVEAIRILHELGFTEIGENRVEAASEKRAALTGLPLRWHMIGNVQRRKIRDILTVFDCIDSVDRLALAKSIHDRAAEMGVTVPVLLEVNVSGEASKHGFTPEDLEAAVAEVRALAHLRVEGLMTMAPLEDDPERTRPVFRALREWADRLNLRECSMGMSNDFEVAIEEGATQVRIGTALFE